MLLLDECEDVCEDVPLWFGCDMLGGTVVVVVVVVLQLVLQ